MAAWAAQQSEVRMDIKQQKHNYTPNCSEEEKMRLFNEGLKDQKPYVEPQTVKVNPKNDEKNCLEGLKMAKYIEREAVIAKLDELCRKWHYTALMPLFIDAIDSLHYYIIDNEQTGILKERLEKELADIELLRRGENEKL